MNYIASIQDFFKSPKWVMNLLLGLVALIIPAVGAIVFAGWLITGFYGRKDDENPATFPDFNFENFMKYLERGVWPFLVNLVTGVVIGPVFGVIMIILMVLFGALGSNSSGFLGLLMTLVFLVLWGAALAAVFFVGTPLTLRSTILQDFGKAFDFGFVKRFIILTKAEMIMAALFMLGVAVVLMLLTFLTCGVGAIVAFAAGPVVVYSWSHLQKQLYKVYLSRGGDPIPVSPKLTDEAGTPPQFT